MNYWEEFSGLKARDWRRNSTLLKMYVCWIVFSMLCAEPVRYVCIDPTLLHWWQKDLFTKEIRDGLGWKTSKSRNGHELLSANVQFSQCTGKQSDGGKKNTSFFFNPRKENWFNHAPSCVTEYWCTVIRNFLKWLYCYVNPVEMTMTASLQRFDKTRNAGRKLPLPNNLKFAVLHYTILIFSSLKMWSCKQITWNSKICGIGMYNYHTFMPLFISIQ